MDTYTINKDKVKIRLTDDEVKELFGGYDNIDYDCPRSRAVLDSLLLNVLPESMLPLDCKKVLIEVTEERSGCSIQITRLYDKGKRLHRTNGRRQYILLFESSEDLIDFTLRENPENLKDVYRFELLNAGGRFALLFSLNGVPIKQCFHFSEYGRLIDSRSVEGAHIIEYSAPICADAAKKLSDAFKN